MNSTQNHVDSCRNLAPRKLARVRLATEEFSPLMLEKTDRRMAS